MEVFSYPSPIVIVWVKLRGRPAPFQTSHYRTTLAGSHTSLGRSRMLNNAYKIKVPNYMIKILGCSRRNVFEIIRRLTVFWAVTPHCRCAIPCVLMDCNSFIFRIK